MNGSQLNDIAADPSPYGAYTSNRLYMTREVSDQSIVNSNITFDLMNNDLELQLNMNFGTTYGQWNYQNRGLSIVFSTADEGQFPGGNLNGDYSRLGVYGENTSNGGPPLPNALAIEFDMSEWGSDFDSIGHWYDGVGSVAGPHIAITKPITPTNENRIEHKATSSYAGMNNGQEHRVVISWKMTAPDQYQLTYKIYATNAPTAGEAPAATSSLTLTTAQALEYFGTEANFQNLRLSLTGGNGYYIGSSSTMTYSFPEVFDYTEYFYLRDYLTGNYTTTPVPGLVTDFPAAGGTTNPITGTLPTGDHDFGPLPTAPPGYKITPGQTTIKYISSTEANNVFRFYYEIDPTQTLPYTIEYYHDGNLMSTTTGSVLTALPTLSSVDISNQPAGTALLRYEFPAGTTNVAPSAAAPYTITTTNNVIRVYYQDNVAPSPPVFNVVEPGATTITGTAEPGSTVNITLPDGTTVISAVADSTTGAFTVAVPTTIVLKPGEVLSGTATDAFNNVSGPATTAVTYNVYILKTDLNAAPLQGAEFSLYQSDRVTLIKRSATLADGKALFNQLIPGSYAFRESFAPTNYILNDTWHTLIINTDKTITVDGVLLGADATTTLTNVFDGSIILTKQDSETAALLSGAVFDLYNSADTKIGSGTTDGSGKISFTVQATGTYRLVETKAPNGYKILTEPVEVIVTQSTNAATVTVANEKNKWVLPDTGGIDISRMYLVGLVIMILTVMIYRREIKKQQTSK